jgi:hypothetical protein
VTRFYRGALEASQTRVKGSKADFGGSREDRNPESEDEELLEELTKAKESYAEEWEKNELGKQKVSRNVFPSFNSSWRQDDTCVLTFLLIFLVGILVLGQGKSPSQNEA